MNVKNVIGRKVAIRVDGKIYEGKVIDRTDHNHAKRIRVYSEGPLEGKVFQPASYTFLEFLD